MRNTALCATIAATLSFSAFSARAQDGEAGNADSLFPPQAVAAAADSGLPESADTHPMIRLTPEKSEIIRLDRAAKGLFVGNPLHLTVMLDGSQRLVLVPRNPGATYFTVLDENDKVIMQRHVIVSGPKQDYVRIRRPGGALPVVYYCPDTCYPVDLMTARTSLPSAGQTAAVGGGSGGIGQSDAYGYQEGDVVESMSLDDFIETMKNVFNTSEGGE